MTQDPMKEYMIITLFVLVIIDRMAALFPVRTKADKTLLKEGAADSNERKIVQAFTTDFETILMTVLLAFFALVGSFQIMREEALLDDVGRFAFALFGFVLSIASTFLNNSIERLDLKIQRK